MPQVILYLLALLVYLALACAVWMVAIVLAFSRRRRALAKKIAAGMAGSFPGVFMFQLISAPLVGGILLTIAGIAQLGEPPESISVFLQLFGLFLALFIIAIPTVASSLGFYTGWRVAWEVAAGRSAREFLHTDRVVGPLVRFLRMRLPFLARVL